MPFIIAEMSANHNGSLERAFGIVEAAAFAGANAIKFQTFTPEEMAIPGYKLESGPWEGRDLVDLYRETHTPYAWHAKLFHQARELGLKPMSSPFSIKDVDFLEDLNCEIYKIASYELVDLELIAKVATTGKPMIMSTGMASVNDIVDAVERAEQYGCDNITLLHCVSEYPTPVSEANLNTMVDLQGFAWDYGLSDHTTGTTVAVAATALGATVIEKHLTLDKIGPDASFSLNPREFKSMVDRCRTASEAMGRVKYSNSNPSLRRSLYWACDIPKGEKIRRHMIKVARPALGASPKHLDDLIGSFLWENVRENDPIQIE